MKSGVPTICPLAVSVDVCSLANPKSRIFQRAVALDKQVARLDVAMDDAAVVRGLQAGAQLHHERQLGVERRRRFAAQIAGQRLPPRRSIAM